MHVADWWQDGADVGQPGGYECAYRQDPHNATQRFGGGSSQLGTSVALHGPDGVDVVAISQRTQTFSPHVFSNVGIDPLKKKILVVKSMQHFYAGFAPIAAKIFAISGRAGDAGAQLQAFGLSQGAPRYFGDSRITMATYDVLITGAQVVDGTGNPWFYGDVAIQGDRIEAITQPGAIAPEQAASVVDATGMVVCPGFIDILSHSIVPLMVDARCLPRLHRA